MKYAVIQTGGKQYKVSEGEVIEVEKISPEGKTFDFPKVLLFVDEKKVLVGQPFLENVRVKGEILGEIKGPKVKVARFKAKSRYRRTKGHRQILSQVKIREIKLKK